MYSVLKCVKFLKSLGLEVCFDMKQGYVARHRYDEDGRLNFNIDRFIEVLESGDDLADYDNNFKYLTEILFRNRNKFKIKYDLNLCKNFIENLGYEVNSEYIFKTAMHNDEGAVCACYLKDIVNYLNGEWDYKDLLRCEIFFVDILARNKDKVMD